jgi:hypothetical protein
VGESPMNCPGDCINGRFCGDGLCTDGENSANCPGDCGGRMTVCGNGRCESPIEVLQCPKDCGPPPPVPLPL